MKILDPRTWGVPETRHLVVDGGRVSCPVRGDCDVENCFACGRLVQYEEGRGGRVVCCPPPRDLYVSFLRRSG